MTTNSINITKCDNQLIIIAVNNDNTNETVEICNIKSGNYNSVDVTIDIVESTSPTNETITLDGLQQDLSGIYTVTVPAGNYSLIYSGINWGGPYNFEFTFNGETHKLINDTAKPLNGAIWNLGNLDLTFKVAEAATV